MKRGENAQDGCHVEDIDSRSLKQWKKEIQHKREDVIHQRNEEGRNEGRVLNIDTNGMPEDIEPMQICKSSTQKYYDVAKEICVQFELNAKQKEVYWLFMDNVLKRLNGEQTKQIISHMGGMAGTGKSRVIKAIKAFHETIGISNSLKVASPTGTSAALINGSTIHSIAQILPNKNKNKKNISSPKLEVSFD